jgi:hypothetical protein
MTTMATSTSLLDWLLDLLRDPASRAAFQADPQGYLNTCGFHDVSGRDLHEALTLISDDDHHGHSDHDVHYPPPHHYEHGDTAEHVLRNYITNNYTTIEEHNTNIDDSVHQNIDTHGGDFNQVIDNDPVVASGDGAVAAGGNIDHSTLTTGDGNVVGDGNHAVTGDDNTTAFGSGDATNANLHNVHTGDGSGLSLGGDATGHTTDNDTTTSVHNSGSGATSVDAAGAHGYADQYANQSEHNDSTHSNYHDDSHNDSHNDYNSANSDHFNDSHDVDIHHA